MPLKQAWWRGSFFTALLLISEKALAWNAGVSADVSFPFVEGDPVMSTGLSFNYPLTKKYSLSIAQGIEKNFYIDAQTREFELSDTVLSFNVYPRTLIPKVGWTVRFMATLPTSNNSQVNEIYSKPEVRWTAAYPLTDTISLVGNAFIRYNWSRYTSAKAQDGIGGAALPEWIYGFGHSGNWTFLPEWTLLYSLNYTEIIHNVITYEGPTDPTINESPDQFYALSLSVNWQFTPDDSVSLSYSFSSFLLQPGVDDYVFFDKEDSRWAIGYARNFH